AMDDGIGTGDQPIQAGAVAEITQYHLDRMVRHQGRLRHASRQYPYMPAGLGKMMDDSRTDETGSTRDGNDAAHYRSCHGVSGTDADLGIGILPGQIVRFGLGAR